MTYWPISSPSVFAATKHGNRETTRVSSDGLEDGELDAERGGSNGASHTPIPQEESVKEEGDVTEPTASGRPRRQRTTDRSHDDDIHGEIIAIRVTRSGHMFATLTRSTLTIWQTKACLQSCPASLLLMLYVAHRCSSLCLALSAVDQNIRPQYRCSPAS